MFMVFTQVTVMGLGPMGRSLAGALLKKGHSVTLWNRSPGKSDELISLGGVLAPTVAEAASASSLIVICVLNYDAVRSIVEQSGDTLRGKTLVNLTGGTPSAAREMAKWASQAGIDYLDGSIIVPAIGEPSGVILYSGSESAYKSYHSTLMNLVGTSTFLSTDPGRASAFDIALLDIFWTAMSGYIHALALADAEQIPVTSLVPYARDIVGMLPDIMSEFANQFDSGHYPGQESNLHSTAAVMQNIITASRESGIDVSIMSEVKALVDKAVELGYGAQDFSRLAEIIRQGSRVKGA